MALGVCDCDAMTKVASSANSGTVCDERPRVGRRGWLMAGAANKSQVSLTPGCCHGETQHVTV